MARARASVCVDKRALILVVAQANNGTLYHARNLDFGVYTQWKTFITIKNTKTESLKILANQSAILDVMSSFFLSRIFKWHHDA